MSAAHVISAAARMAQAFDIARLHEDRSIISFFYHGPMLLTHLLSFFFCPRFSICATPRAGEFAGRRERHEALAFVMKLDVLAWHGRYQRDIAVLILLARPYADEFFAGEYIYHWPESLRSLFLSFSFNDDITHYRDGDVVTIICQRQFNYHIKNFISQFTFTAASAL